tara:strand:+ start:390 stop:743 length:354 start_codon:yes stop_codon:yes gene_type:complete
MELWRQLIKRITKWNGTKRVKGTTELGDENIFCENLDDEFIIFRRAYVKEFLFKDGYKVYLVNIEQIEEDAKLDEWADREEKEQIELHDSLNMSLDAKNDKIIRIQEGMDKHDPGDS